MRKIMSCVLSVIMVLSVFGACFSVSAATEGTAINSADDFLNMAAEGVYYLNADITVNVSYPNAFNGTFDGNGHTVTVTVPMFADFSGTVKNLTIAGEVYSTDADAAAFAVLSSNGVIAENVTNNASVTVLGTGLIAAGFIATDKATQTAKTNPASTYTNVVNNGEVYIESAAGLKPTAAGLVAFADSAIFTGCVNNAKVTANGACARAAGICARVSPVKSTNVAEAYNCVNNGDITSVESYLDADGVSVGTGASETAGIFANVGVKSNVGVYRVWGCVNNGTIKGTYRTSAMIGYAYGSGSNQYVDIQFCINTGDLYYGRTASNDGNVHDWCSPFVGYTNTPFTTVKYNIDLGSYIRDPQAINLNPGMCFIGCSNADVMQCDVVGNYLVNKASFEYYTYASSDSNAAQRHLITEVDGILPTTLEEVKSGKVAYEINTLAAADEFGFAEGYAFYQNIGSDNLPTVDNTHGWVVLSGSTYVNGSAEPETTEAPATEAPVETTEAPAVETEAPVEETEAPAVETEAPAATEAPADTEPAKSGCGSFVAGGVAILAILGTALVIKKRD